MGQGILQYIGTEATAVIGKGEKVSNDQEGYTIGL
jgi:hypothetical protein